MSSGAGWTDEQVHTAIWWVVGIVVLICAIAAIAYFTGHDVSSGCRGLPQAPDGGC